MNPLLSRKPLTHPRRLQTVPLADFPAARQHWLNSERLRLYPAVLLACYLVFVVIRVYYLVWRHEAVGPLAGDFLPFWSASYLALHGHAVDAYNVNALTAVELHAMPYFSKVGGIMPWLYPPTFLLVVYPLALVPYNVAAVAFVGGTCALFVTAIRAIVAERMSTLLALAFPGIALVAIAGQNGALTAAIAGFGLVLLRRRPGVAGICLGLLCMKPQLAVLFPVALLCARSWRALASFSLTAGATLALAVLAFGTGTLSAFLQNAGMAAGCVEAGRAALARMPSALAFVIMLHGPLGLAYIAQGVCALGAAAAVCYAWSGECAYSLRAATLICASLLVSPYLYDYDLVWYGVLIAWYCRHAMVRGWRRGEREWLVVLWLAPFAGTLAVTHVHVQFMPLISAASLWMLVRRIAVERREPAVLQRGAGE